MTTTTTTNNTTTTTTTTTTLVLTEDEMFDLAGLDPAEVELLLSEANGRIRLRRVSTTKAAAAAFLAWLLRAETRAWGGFVPNSYGYGCPVPVVRFWPEKDGMGVDWLRGDARRSWGAGSTVVVGKSQYVAVVADDGCVDVLPRAEARGRKVLSATQLLRAASEGRVRGCPRIPEAWVY